jgi:hypothetical protein
VVVLELCPWTEHVDGWRGCAGAVVEPSHDHGIRP